MVDDDRTPLSRRLIQALDADEAISVAVRAPALEVAQQALFDRQVFGILEIPPDTEREVLKGNRARIPAYVDSAYFLVFNRTLQGIPEGAGDTNVADISRGLRMTARKRGWLCRAEPRRAVDRAAVQSDRWLRELCCAGRLRPDHSADPADGGGDLIALTFRRRRRTRRSEQGAGRFLGRALAHLTVMGGARSLSRCSAAHLRLLDTGPD